MKQLLLVVAAVLFALPAAAETPTLESTAGNVKALLADLSEKAKEDKAAVASVEAKNIHQETDCTNIEFAEGAGPVSGTHQLETRTWLEECRYIPVPPGGGYCIPERRLLYWDRADVRVEIAERADAAPAEKFMACMTGRWLSLRVRNSPFKYDVKEKNGVFTLTRKK